MRLVASALHGQFSVSCLEQEFENGPCLLSAISVSRPRFAL